MKRLVLIMVATVWCLNPLLAEDTHIASVEYWIDSNHSSVMTSTAMEFDVNCTSLSAGLHTLHYRVADSQGRYSALREQGFYKLPAMNKATKVESLQYWWDDKHEKSVTPPYEANQFVLPTNALPYGLHSLNYRVKDDAGRWSEIRSHYFYKGETLDSARIVSYSYWWNDLTDKVVTKSIAASAKIFVVDENIRVPEEARTNYAGHYTAKLNIAVTDSRGRIAYVQTNVTYPDNDAPITDINADKYVTNSTVTLTWGEKSKDKMGDYNVYYSKDNGPFMLWLPDTKQTTASFKGEKGSVYLFTVTGRDAFGNREAYDETKTLSVSFE